MSLTVQKNNLLYFTFLGLLYSFVIKNIVSFSYWITHTPEYYSRDIIYHISNPSIYGELWLVVGLSYYLLIYLISESWIKSIHSFLLSFSLIKQVIKKLNFIKFKKISGFMGFLSYLVLIITIISFIGGFHLISVILLFYLGTLMVLSLRKRKKKEYNLTN